MTVGLTSGLKLSLQLLGKRWYNVFLHESPFNVRERYNVENQRLTAQVGIPHPSLMMHSLFQWGLMTTTLPAAKSINRLKVTSEFPKVQHQSQKECWKLLPACQILMLEWLYDFSRVVFSKEFLLCTLIPMCLGTCPQNNSTVVVILPTKYFQVTVWPGTWKDYHSQPLLFWWLRWQALWFQRAMSRSECGWKGKSMGDRGKPSCSCHLYSVHQGPSQPLHDLEPLPGLSRRHHPLLALGGLVGPPMHQPCSPLKFHYSSSVSEALISPKYPLAFPPTPFRSILGCQLVSGLCQLFPFNFCLHHQPLCASLLLYFSP